MGASFAPLVDISEQVDGGIPNGLWQRARLYKESNPIFQFGNRLDYAQGEGRLWGFGLHSNGGGYTRKPVVYYSDNNGKTWHGPESLHGAMFPGTDTGYGDMKRRIDGTFVAATYFATRDSSVADTEQYTFGGQRVRLLVEVDRDGDEQADADSGWREIYGGRNEIGLSQVSGARWRVQLELRAPQGASVPAVRCLQLQTEPKEGVTVLAASARRPKVLLDWQMQPPVERDGERILPDAGPAGRDARLLGEVRYAADPPRFELSGQAALVAPEAIEPDRLTVEALFRADRVEGDLQHIISVFDPWDDRAPNNPRQWTLEIHEGHLRFGIYGHDQRWHLVSSTEPLSRGWHHAVGTFRRPPSAAVLERLDAATVGRRIVRPISRLHQSATTGRGQTALGRLQRTAGTLRIRGRYRPRASAGPGDGGRRDPRGISHGVRVGPRRRSSSRRWLHRCEGMNQRHLSEYRGDKVCATEGSGRVGRAASLP